MNARLALLVLAAVVLAPASALAASGGTWTETALLQAFDAYGGDMFGYSVAVSGDTAVIGAYQDDDGGPTTGSAYVFVRSGTSWVLEQKLTAADPGMSDMFGYSVAIDAETIVVGAIQGDAFITQDTGCAYVFTRAAGVWSQQTKLTAADGTWDDDFGDSVAVQGDTAVAGAPRDDDAGADSGSAYVFVRAGTLWSQQGKLAATDASGDDRFGSSVTLDGDTAVIGADHDEAPNSDSGSAYVFVRGGTTWSQEQKLIASDAPTTAYLGCSVSLDDDRVAVGAWGDDTHGTSTGAVYVFERAGSAWSEAAKITESGLANFDSLGRSVSLDGLCLVAGAPYEDVNGDTMAGTVYVYESNGTTWSRSQRVVASDSAPNVKYGWSVSLAGPIFLSGAPEHDGTAYNAGAAYVNEPSLPWSSYCTSGTSAAGCSAWLTATGVPSVSAVTGFVVSAIDVPAQKNGLFFYGFSGAQANPWWNTTSYQCVVPPVFRTPLLPGSGPAGTCGGRFDRDFSAYWSTANPLKVPAPAQQVWMQCWYRDPMNPGGTTSMSDAITFTMAP